MSPWSGPLLADSADALAGESPSPPASSSVGGPSSPPGGADVRARIDQARAQLADPNTPGYLKPGLRDGMMADYRLLYGTEPVAVIGAEGAEDATATNSAPLPALPEGVMWDRSLIGEAQPVADDLGVGAAVRQGMTLLAQLAADEMPDATEAEGALRQAWGPAYDRRLAATHYAFKHLPVRVQEAVDRFGNHPRLVAFLSEWGERLMSQPMTDRRLTAMLKGRREQLGADNPTIP